MTFTVRESPPFLSIQARVAVELRSLSELVAIVVPLRSRPVRIGESFLTISPTVGASVR